MTLPPTTLGYTFACREGFDASFRLAQSDEEIVADEVLHRCTTRSVLGDTPEAIDWGINLFERCGDHMSDPELAALGPEIAAMLQQSPLIEHADVRTERGPETGLLSLFVYVDVTPKNPTTGDVGAPLSFIFQLDGDTFQRVGDPDGNAGT